jgi:hypothetical protein
MISGMLSGRCGKSEGGPEMRMRHEIGADELVCELARYNKLFFMTDTCQANTLYKRIYSPNVLATGSSELGENSYSVSPKSSDSTNRKRSEANFTRTYSIITITILASR